MVARVATAGHPLEIFPEKPELPAFLQHLYDRGILEPFKSVQMKFRIQSPISVALSLVYAKAANVNEYSGRYSKMPESSYTPCAEDIVSHAYDLRVCMDDAQQALALIEAARKQNYQDYEWLVGEIDLARELARTPLELDNDTIFFWKMDLPSLLEFTQQQRARTRKWALLIEYLDTLEHAAYLLAPLSTSILTQDRYEKKSPALTYPTDDKVVDGPLLPAPWQPQNTRRPTATSLEERLFVPVSYLDKGAIQAVDYMGYDDAPADSARVSYGEGTRRLQENKHLIKYLFRHRHTTPFEHVEIAFEGKPPIFVDPRQAGRHRTLEDHGFMGYVPVGDEYFMPPEEELKHQDRKNRQGRGNLLDDELKVTVLECFMEGYEREVQLAQELRRLGVNEDIVRGRKGVGFYTRRWRTGDIHNWGHFLGLRLDAHAQKETQLEAQIYADFIRLLAPTTMEALDDYQRNAVRFNRQELPVLQSLLHITQEQVNNVEWYRQFGFVIEGKDGVPKLNREGEELQAKLKRFL